MFQFLQLHGLYEYSFKKKHHRKKSGGLEVGKAIGHAQQYSHQRTLVVL
jgi:hypothetical protein